MKREQADRLMITIPAAIVLFASVILFWKTNKTQQEFRASTPSLIVKSDSIAKKQALVEYTTKYALIKERKEEFLNIMRFAAQSPSFFESSSFLKDSSWDETFKQSVSILCAVGAVLDAIPGAGELDLKAFMERINTGKITDTEYGHPIHEPMLAGTNAEIERIIRLYEPEFKANYIASIISDNGVKKTFELID